MTRNRTCDNPEFGGNDCVGESTDTQNCGEDPCPSTYPTSEYFKQLYSVLIHFISRLNHNYLE